MFVSAEYSLSISSRPLFPISPKTPFWLQTAIEHIKPVANKYKIPLNQIPSGKHTSGGFHLGHINGYHHNISDFMYLYHGVSSKFLDYYLVLFYWVEKNMHKTYLEQAYDIITLLANQTKKIPLAKFKYKPISFDMKRLAI